MMRDAGRVRAVLILASGAATSLAVVTHAPTPLRACLVFSFVCAGPGLAWVGLLRLRDPLAEGVLGVALSLVAATLLSEGLVLVRLWSAPAILFCLVAATVPACVLALAGRGRPRERGNAA